MHYLIVKQEKLCIHNYLCLKAEAYAKHEGEVENYTKFEVDRFKTIDYVVEKIDNHFPTATGNTREFLIKNKCFVDNFYSGENIAEKIAQYERKTCHYCSEETKNWHLKAKDTYIISLGECKKV